MFGIFYPQSKAAKDLHNPAVHREKKYYLMQFSVIILPVVKRGDQTMKNGSTSNISSPTYTSTRNKLAPLIEKYALDQGVTETDWPGIQAAVRTASEPGS